MSSKAEDELAIRNLYAACAFAADDYDAAAYADSFTPDGVLKVEDSNFMAGLVASGGAPFSNDRCEIIGRQKIHEFLAFLGRFNINSLHAVPNFVLEKLDGDYAETRAVNAAFVNGGLEVYGRYVDKVQRCGDGKWRFSHRREIFRFEKAQQTFANE